MNDAPHTHQPKAVVRVFNWVILPSSVPSLIGLIGGVASSRSNRSTLNGARTDKRHSSSTRAATRAQPSIRKIARRNSSDAHRARAPGDLLVRPLAVVALMVLIVNDHILKPGGPGLLTGKLSDIAGLVFLPLLLISLYELARAGMRKPWRLGDCGLVAIAAAVAIGFAATKLSTPVAATYGDVLGWLRWPLIGRWRQVAISQDPTDVLCTPCAIVAWIESRRLPEVRGISKLGT
jgi:hypothetical protein